MEDDSTNPTCPQFFPNLTPSLTASSPGILGQKILCPNEKNLHYRSLSLATSLHKAFTSGPEVKDDSHINISKVAKYCDIIKQSNSDTVIDKCVNVTFEKNIGVPKVAVEVTRCSVETLRCNNKRYSSKYPGVTSNFVSPLETEIIKGNAEGLRTKLNIDEKLFYDELFQDQSEGSKEKENIVGHYLSRGLKEPRHPGEVFRHLKIEKFYKKGEFTDEENIKIMEAVKKNGDKVATFRSLEQDLRRYYHTIHSQYMGYLKLKHQDKTLTGKLTLEESQKILQEVYSKVPDFLNGEESVSAVVRGEELAAEMNRTPQYIAEHWNRFLYPLLTRHEAGVLEVDFNMRTVKHCADNGIRYAQEADWAAIASLPQFRGTTAPWLKYTYGHVRSSYKQFEKERGNKVKDAEVTSEVLLGYLQTRKSYSKKNTESMRENEIIEFYESLKDQDQDLRLKTWRPWS